MLRRLKLDLQRNYQAYLMVLPSIVLIFFFCYIPMYGVLMAFENYRPQLGVLGSEWVGLYHFKDFFTSPHSLNVLRNTVVISVYSLLVGFPFPIILALLLNEVRCQAYKRTVQTISYMPYFISMVVMCGIIVDFTKSGGVISTIVANLTGTTSQNLLGNAAYFRPIYIISNSF